MTFQIICAVVMFLIMIWAFLHPKRKKKDKDKDSKKKDWEDYTGG